MKSDDWFGVLPEHWSSAALGYYFDVTLGKMLNAGKDTGGGVEAPYLAAGSIQPEELILDETRTMPFTEQELIQYELRSNDIVVVEGGAGYGRSHLLKEDLPGWGFQNHVARLRARGSVDPKFALHCLKACLASGYIEASNRTATLPSLSRDVLRALPIPLPPSDEQRAIADFLDREIARIEELTTEQERLIGLLRERRAATIESSLRGIETKGARLKHVVRSVRQGWSPQCCAWPADGVETWAVLKAGAANGGVFRPLENKELPSDLEPRPEIVVNRGDLVISRANTRELVGSAAVVESEYPRLMLCDKLYAFQLDTRTTLAPFVALVLGSRRWRDLIEQEATGASYSMLNVSQADILNLPMPLPTLHEQRAIVERVVKEASRIDALIHETERMIELGRERRAALITAAVTGQIDVAGSA